MHIYLIIDSFTADVRRAMCVVLMLVQHHRRWTGIEPALSKRLASVVILRYCDRIFWPSLQRLFLILASVSQPCNLVK